MKKSIFLLLALGLAGCDAYVDPRQLDAAINICGGKDRTAYIHMSTVENPTTIIAVKCTDGAKYEVNIPARNES